MIYTSRSIGITREFAGSTSVASWSYWSYIGIANDNRDIGIIRDIGNKSSSDAKCRKLYTG